MRRFASSKIRSNSSRDGAPGAYFASAHRKKNDSTSRLVSLSTSSGQIPGGFQFTSRIRITFRQFLRDHSFETAIIAADVTFHTPAFRFCQSVIFGPLCFSFGNNRLLNSTPSPYKYNNHTDNDNNKNNTRPYY